jgi:hypothetical protein
MARPASRAVPRDLCVFARGEGFVTMEVRLHPEGPVAQLGARLNGIQEVTGSIPVRSTISKSLILKV